MAERTLSTTALKHFRTLLDRRRAETLVHLAALEDDLGVARAARAEGSADDEHDPDGPTMSQAWSQLSGQIVDVNAEIIAIDAAVDRIERGSYGICTNCGNQIARARLEARPAAELCIDCARKQR